MYNRGASCFLYFKKGYFTIRYLGGKFKIAKHIGETILEHKRPECNIYVEPFMGAASVMVEMANYTRMPLYGSDAHEDLMLMWKALQEDWIPPKELTEEQWKELKESEPSPLRGFAGFGCSFGGQFFIGYARSKTTNYADETCRSLMRTINAIRRAELRCCDYREVEPKEQAIIYCDKPYEGTTPYRGLPEFDHEAFWNKAREWSEQGHQVFVSEYKAPDDFTCIWEREQYKFLNHPKAPKTKRIERLFVYA